MTAGRARIRRHDPDWLRRHTEPLVVSLTLWVFRLQTADRTPPLETGVIVIQAEFTIQAWMRRQALQS